MERDKEQLAEHEPGALLGGPTYLPWHGRFGYRLYDIDVVINKTLVYGALAAFIAGVTWRS